MRALLEIISESSHPEFQRPKFQYFLESENNGKLSYPINIQMGLEYIDFDDLLHTNTTTVIYSESKLLDRRHLSNLTLSEKIEYDRVKEFGQYGRIPFAVYLKYNDSKTIYHNEIPKLFYLNDFDYRLPKSTIEIYWNGGQWVLGLLW